MKASSLLVTLCMAFAFSTVPAVGQGLVLGDTCSPSFVADDKSCDVKFVCNGTVCVRCQKGKVSCPSGLVCAGNDGNAECKSKYCATDAECAENEAGTQCIGDDNEKTCRPGPVSVSCSNHGECGDNMVCKGDADSGEKKCQKCSSATDCTVEHEGKVCNGGVGGCVACIVGGCHSLTHYMGKVCRQRDDGDPWLCSFCEGNDCDDGMVCTGDPALKTCQSCRTSTDCVDKDSNKVCKNITATTARCKNCEENTDDCTTLGYAHRFCRGSGLCQVCRDDHSDCTGTHVCRLAAVGNTEKRCQPCAGEDDCTAKKYAGMVCKQVAGDGENSCQPCAKDECTGGKVCQNGRCQFCKESEDCVGKDVGKVCKAKDDTPTDKVCAACSTNHECTKGLVCKTDDGAKTCQQCEKHDDCNEKGFECVKVDEKMTCTNDAKLMEKAKEGLSGWAIAAIVFAVIFTLLLVAGAVYYFFFYSQMEE